MLNSRLDKGAAKQSAEARVDSDAVARQAHELRDENEQLQDEVEKLREKLQELQRQAFEADD